MERERDKLLRLNHFRFPEELKTAAGYLKQLGLKPESPIWIYPVPKLGWYALVGFEGRVLIIHCLRGVLSINSGKCYGILANGMFRRGPEIDYPLSLSIMPDGIDIFMRV